MAEQHLLPESPNFPNRLPRTPEDTISWAGVIQEVIREQYRLLADRLEGVITVGVIADRPAANGSFRFYFAADEAPPVMYFDDGTWHALNAT